MSDKKISEETAAAALGGTEMIPAVQAGGNVQLTPAQLLTYMLAASLTASLALKAPLASPTFTGDPKAPTPTLGDNDTSIATTAFVQAAIAALVNAAPGTLDTLKELADALGDDPNYATTITAALALKAPLASPTFTGDPKAPTPAPGDNDTSIATSAFVVAALASYLLKAGGTMSGALNWAPVVDVASAGTTDIGAAASNVVRITGTTTITGLGTSADGTMRWVRFAGALTLTHNATSLILPGAANIVTAAGDAARFVSEGSGNWRCTAYQRAAQAPLVVGTNVQAWDADLDAAAASGVASAWTAFTPTITSGSGTITTSSVTASYLKMGKLVVFQMVITVTTAGTGAGALQATLPTTANSVATFAGRENAVTGYQVQGNVSAGSNILSIMSYQNATVIANGAVVRISGFYESST